VTLEERNAALERRILELERENAALRQELEKLRKDIEEWKRGFRERGKRRSSKAEGKKAEASGKRPGRKAGHEGASRPVPERIDRTEVHPAPEYCECGGATEETDEVESTIVQDIPPVMVENVRHVAPVRRCSRCGRRAVARLPGAVASGESVAKVQVGPNALAIAVGLRFEQKISLEGICNFVQTWFGLDISRGGLCQLLARWAGRSSECYREIETNVREAKVAGADETGIVQNGVRGYAWLVRTETASLFRIELSRGEWVIAAMLGDAFIGILCTDFYSAYTCHDDWTHAYCGAHTIREAKKIAEVSPCAATETFRDRLGTIYKVGKQAQQSGEVSARHGVRVRMGRLIADTALGTDPDVARLQSRLDEHFDGVLTFLDFPDVPSDNNGTERDIRPLAVYRKVTGGTRSPRGSQTLAHWMSVTQTLRKNDLPLRPFILDLHRAFYEGSSPPSVFCN
jgi:transposase